MVPQKPHHIIAIGASAGGMEEISSFFDRTPIVWGCDNQRFGDKANSIFKREPLEYIIQPHLKRH